jgi:adenylate kinase
VCDVCGSEIFEYRADDNESSLRKRLEEYHKKTHPLIDFYSKSGILCNVSADVCLENVSKSIVEILKDKKEKR